MISYDEAMNCINKINHLLPTEYVLFDKILGRIAAESVFSPCSSPPFNNSAMDGYAFNTAETVLASDTHPLFFPVSDVVAAGKTNTEFVKNTAIKIMTGAVIPIGYDTVLPVEQAVCSTINNVPGIVITSPLLLDSHIRYQGEDIVEGDCLLQSGELINQNHMMVLATVGLKKLAVRRKLRVSLLSTGHELVDDYEQALSPGEIYNSNSPYLKTVFQSENIEMIFLGQIKDDRAIFKQKIESVMQSDVPPDLIISTGAVSKGDFDFIPAALQEMGATTLFHGVAIKPGKPIFCATLGSAIYIGLPGNPISAAVGYEFFIKPIMQKIQNMTVEKGLFAKLDHPFIKKGPMRQFLKARAYLGQDACLYVTILSGQESFKVKPLLQANAWVVIDENVTEMNEHECVQIHLVGAIKYDKGN